MTVVLEEQALALPVELRSRLLPRVPSCAGGILRLSALCGFRRFTCTGFVVLLRPGSEDLIVVGFTSFRANLPRTSCAGGILRLWALYEHVLWRLLRPRSREGESARGFEASSALTCRRHLAQEVFCGFGHFTSTCFGVCFGHILAKVSPREVLRLLPRSRVAFFCVRFL